MNKIKIANIHDKQENKCIIHYNNDHEWLGEL
jgi:hypothetical protein